MLVPSFVLKPSPEIDILSVFCTNYVEWSPLRHTGTPRRSPKIRKLRNKKFAWLKIGAWKNKKFWPRRKTVTFLTMRPGVYEWLHLPINKRYCENDFPTAFLRISYGCAAVWHITHIGSHYPAISSVRAHLAIFSYGFPTDLLTTFFENRSRVPFRPTGSPMTDMETMDYCCGHISYGDPTDSLRISYGTAAVSIIN